MLELYNFPMSTCSQKVRIVLAEKGLEYVDRRVNNAAGEHLTPEYLKMNPNGVVPTLVHDGQPIIDSSVICEYLDEVFPEPPLSPPDPVGKAKMRAWLRYLEEVPTVAIRYPSFNRVLVKRFTNHSDAEFEKEATVRPLRKHFYKRMTQKGFTKEDIDASLEDLQQTIDRMEKALKETGGPWIMGEQFTIVEACVTPSIDRMEDLGFQHMWEDNHPLVTEWWARLKARPSYQKTYFKGARFSDAYAEQMAEPA